MKVEIWSDIMCPFCYIGKRRFEEALAGFESGAHIEVEWKSFQLNPHLRTDTSISIYQSLADSKGWQLDYAKHVSEQVSEMAMQVGLSFNFDQAVVANSFNAHRLCHLAKKHGLGTEAEEVLFRAYFTNGKNIDDIETLTSLATEIGIDSDEAKQVLLSDAFTEDVNQDISEADQLGIRGVPFFVFNSKYAVSGAQPNEVFLNALSSAYLEQEQRFTNVSGTSASSCEDDAC